MLNTMKDFLYEIIESGEQIFVECEEKSEVPGIMRGWGFNMNELEFIEEVEPWVAEAMGNDTYTRT